MKVKIATFAIKEGTVQIPYSIKTDEHISVFFDILKSESKREDHMDIMPTYTEEEDWHYTNLGCFLSKNNCKVLIPMKLSNITLEELRICVDGKLTIYEQTDLTPETLKEMNKIIEKCLKKQL